MWRTNLPKPHVKLSKVRVEGGGLESPSFHVSSCHFCVAHLLLLHLSLCLTPSFFFSLRFSTSTTLCFLSVSSSLLSSVLSLIYQLLTTSLSLSLSVSICTFLAAARLRFLFLPLVHLSAFSLSFSLHLCKVWEVVPCCERCYRW